MNKYKFLLKNTRFFFCFIALISQVLTYLMVTMVARNELSLSFWCQKIPNTIVINSQSLVKISKPSTFHRRRFAPTELFPTFPLAQICAHTPMSRPCHTFFDLAQASRASLASSWCQRTRNEQGYHLGKWRGHTF